uniref:Uncharacterized protein n=1 Tax=Ditylenchus dipsaci TaxID=166011 RepID=A0A915DPW6_9BILA
MSSVHDSSTLSCAPNLLEEVIPTNSNHESKLLILAEKEGLADREELHNSPYKMTVYLLILELEKAAQNQQHSKQVDLSNTWTDHKHAFFGALLMNLVEQDNVPITLLKCIVHHFIGPLMPTVEHAFLKTLQQKIDQPNLVLFPTQLSTTSNNFFEANSVIGDFVKKLRCNLNGLNRAVLNGQWLTYLSTHASVKQIKDISSQFNWNIEAMIQEIDELECAINEQNMVEDKKYKPSQKKLTKPVNEEYVKFNENIQKTLDLYEKQQNGNKH